MRKLWFVVGIIFLILLVIGLFFYFATAAPSKPKEGAEIKNPAENLGAEQAISQFNESYIDYLVFAIGGWKLHNIPMTSDNPRIKVIVDGESFVSEIAGGKIKTEKREIDNEDITLTTSRQEIVNAILSLDMKEYIKSSVQNGKTEIELKAGYATLFSKGYLNLYQELTGKSFTASVVRIFDTRKMLFSYAMFFKAQKEKAFLGLQSSLNFDSAQDFAILT